MFLIGLLLHTFAVAFVAGWQTFEFEPIQVGRQLDVYHIQSSKVVSVIQCAELCIANTQCKSFSFECIIPTSASVQRLCLLFDISVETTGELHQSSTMCFVQRKGYSTVFTDVTTAVLTSPLPTVSSTATSTSPQSSTPITVQTSTSGATQTHYIRDMIYGPRDVCSTNPSSQLDFIVITEDGVFMYDEIEDLTVGPCKGPLAFTSVFGGYADLTSVDQVSGMLVYQSSVELFSTALNKVYKWQIQSPSLVKQTTSLYFTELTNGIAEVGVTDFKWCTFRQYNQDERQFYLGNDEFYLKSYQAGNRRFTKTDTVLNQNNFNMNPWRDIPDNTVAACSYTNEPNKYYAMIDSNLQVYTYHLDYNANNNDPTSIVTNRGTIQF